MEVDEGSWKRTFCSQETGLPPPRHMWRTWQSIGRYIGALRLDYGHVITKGMVGYHLETCLVQYRGVALGSWSKLLGHGPWGNISSWRCLATRTTRLLQTGLCYIHVGIDVWVSLFVTAIRYMSALADHFGFLVLSRRLLTLSSSSCTESWLCREGCKDSQLRST